MIMSPKNMQDRENYENISLAEAVDGILTGIYGDRVTVMAANEYQSCRDRGLIPDAERLFVRGIVCDTPVRKMGLMQRPVLPEEKAAKYGVDAFRLSLIVGRGLKRDIHFSDTGAVSMNRFCNKLRNAAHFIIMRKNDGHDAAPDDELLKSELTMLEQSFGEKMSSLRPGIAAEELCRFVKRRFCGVYIERCKQGLVSPAALRMALLELLEMLYPFAPAICGELIMQLGTICC